MRDLQYLRIQEVFLDGEVLRVLFKNADFLQLRTLLLEDVIDFDAETWKSIAWACPELQRLVLSLKGRPPPGPEDDVLTSIVSSCPKLQAICFRGASAMTGEGWLDNIKHHLPLLQCLVISCNWSDKTGPALLRRADRVRSEYPRLCVLIGSKPRRYNDEVEICDDDVVEVMRASPRPCDLKAGRVRFPDILQEAVRSRIAKDEARSWFRDHS
jgi:hypothetical protein